MNNHYKILIVEDNPVDAELGQREICHVLESVEFDVVYTLEKFQDSLKNFKPDIIVSDFNMPDFDGMTVIHITRKEAPMVPVIIFTGTIDEETAAETVKAGAVDYVLKENTVRLRQGVLHALEIKKMWQDKLTSEEKLRESEERFRILFEQAADTILRVDPDGNIVGINTSGTEMTGYTKEELLNMKVAEIFPKEELAQKPIRYDLLQQGQVVINERTFVRKDGSTCLVEMHSKMMPDKTYQSIARDITQRKKAEKELIDSEERLNDLIQSLPLGIVIHTNDKIVFANLAAFKIMEVPKDHSLSNYNIYDFIHPDYKKIAHHRVGQALKDNTNTKSIEQNFLTFNKKIITVEVTSLPLAYQGNPSILTVFNDITARKRIETQLKESEAKYRSFFESTGTAIAISEEDTTLSLVNSKYAELVGLPKNEIENKRKYTEFMVAEDLEFAIKTHNHRITDPSKAPKSYEIRFKNARNEIKNVLIYTDLIPGTNKSLASLLDITDRKNAETLLKESEAKYRTIFENTGTATLIVEEDKTISLINSQSAELLGLTKEEVENKKYWTEFIVPEDLDKMLKMHKLRRTEPSKALRSYEIHIKNARGEIRTILLYIELIPGTNKSLASLLDITDRKATETLLKESEAKYKSFFENSGTATTIIEEDTTISLANTKFIELLGIPKEELENKRKWTEFVVPEDLDKMKKMHILRRTDPSKALISYEFDLKDAKGNIKNILLYADLIPGTKKSLASLLDITETKKATKEIIENERQFRNIIELANISLSIVNFDGSIEYINQQAIKTFGYEHKDIPTMDKWWVLSYPDEKYRKEVIDQWMGLVNKAIKENKEIERKEYKVTCKDGSVKTMIIFGVIINDKLLCLFEDITDRKNAEEELRKSRMLLRTMIDSLPIWIAAVDVDGNYFIANKYYESFFKRPLELIEGHNFKDFFPENDYIRHNAYFVECLSSGRSIEVSDILTDENGGIVHIFGTYTPLFDENRKLFGMAILAMDVSKQKVAEIALKESETQFRTTFENAPIGMSLNHINGKFHQTNQAFCQMMGYTQKELQKFSFTDITYPDDIEASKTFIHNILTQNSNNSFLEKRYIKKDGSVIWAITSASVLKDINNNPKFFVVQVLDITELKTTEQKLKETKDQFEVVFDNGPDAVLLTRIEDGHYIDSNKTFTRYTGYTPDDLRGKSTLDIDIWGDPTDRNKIIQEVKSKGYCHNFELQVKNKDNSARAIELSAEVVFLKGIPHLLTISRDIAERKKMEKLLLNQNKELQELNATKDRFFSIIAHDLKDPHNAILGFSEILSGNYDILSDQDRKNYIKNILLSSQSLARLLQNLLEWAGSQTGRLAYQPEEIDLTDIIKETINLLQYQAKIKQIRLISDIASKANVFADPNMTKTILRNLVSNAIKFTHRNGFVKISSVNVPDIKTNTGFVEISVADNGVGISKENLDKLFRLDHKIRTQGTEDEMGSGLGLILCKELIEKNKGSMNITSEENVGSTISFSLPEKNID